MEFGVGVERAGKGPWHPKARLPRHSRHSRNVACCARRRPGPSSDGRRGAQRPRARARATTRHRLASAHWHSRASAAGEPPSQRSSGARGWRQARCQPPPSSLLSVEPAPGSQLRVTAACRCVTPQTGCYTVTAQPIIATYGAPSDAIDSDASSTVTPPLAVRTASTYSTVSAPMNNIALLNSRPA
jgi:hypothetical protein